MTSFSQFIYFFAALCLILGLKRMSSPKTARDGIILAGLGMTLAVVITFFTPTVHGITNIMLIMIALLIGTAIAFYSAKRVKMTDMPQMIALYNGMGGGAAGAIAAIHLLQPDSGQSVSIFLALLGAYIGLFSFSGSLVAYAKLEGLMTKILTFPNQNKINATLGIVSIVFGLGAFIFPTHHLLLLCFFITVLALGLLLTLPIGGANMPVVISLFNAMTGLAVAFEGAVLQNNTMIIAGTVVGASGTLLTQLMAKAMNQSLRTILLQPHPQQSAGQEKKAIEGTQKTLEISDAALMLSYAKTVIIVPGYGLAVAQAQHKVWELASLLHKMDITVKFAIHPVAGRMPGHMNVLLAEAGVPYDHIFDMEEINADFNHTDIAIVIGANDVVNPAAKTDASSPIYGMPVLAVEEAKHVFVIKRGQGAGFSGIENDLFYRDNTHMLYGDAQGVLNKLIHALKNT